MIDLVKARISMSDLETRKTTTPSSSSRVSNAPLKVENEASHFLPTSD